MESKEIARKMKAYVSAKEKWERALNFANTYEMFRLEHGSASLSVNLLAVNFEFHGEDYAMHW